MFKGGDDFQCITRLHGDTFPMPISFNSYNVVLVC